MADLEKARREIRYAKSAADDRRWDLLEARLATIEAALAGASDAEKAPVLAEITPLRATMVAAVRAEQAGRIERDIQRSIDAAADDLQRGGTGEIQLQKATTRLASPEARDCLSPEATARLQAGIAALQARIGGAAAAPAGNQGPVTTAAKPASGATTAGSAAAPAAKPAAAPTPPAPAAASAADPERARAIENELVRILRYAADEMQSRPDLSGTKLEQFAVRIDAADTQQHLAKATVERLKAEAAALQTRLQGAAQQERAREIEDQVARFVRQAESDLSWNERSARDMLARATERLGRDDAQAALSAAVRERFAGDIARIQAQVDGASRKAALERAEGVLQELEERVARPIFDGSAPDYHVVAEIEAMQHRVRAAVEDLAETDDGRRAVEARLATVAATVAAASSALAKGEACARLEQVWQLECDAITGWESEDGERTYELPRTALAVRRLDRFLNDSDLLQIRAEHRDDAGVESIFTTAQRAYDAALQRLHDSFQGVLAALEAGPRPTNRFDLERPGHLAGRAGSDFEGSVHCDENVARAKALADRWQAEIDADRRQREAKYAEASAAAAAAWARILPTIDAAEGLDPLDPRTVGTTVLLRGIRNRIGWDFSGPVDFAIWIGGTPVVGNYAEHVAAAVRDACERTGLPIDDHTDWDAVLVVGRPGTIKQRFQVEVRDRHNVQVGTIEEWRPVPCVLCTVVGLAAGPAAVAPQR